MNKQQRNQINLYQKRRTKLIKGFKNNFKKFYDKPSRGREIKAARKYDGGLFSKFG